MAQPTPKPVVVGTAADLADYTPSRDELTHESDTGVFKVGDGATVHSGLDAAPGGGTSVAPVFGDYLWVACDTALAFTAAQNKVVTFDGIYDSAGTSLPLVEGDLPIGTVPVAAEGVYSILVEAWMEGANPGGQVVLQALDAEDAALPQAQGCTFDFSSPTDDKRKASVTLALPAGAKLKLAVANGSGASPQDMTFAAMFVTRIL